VGNIVASNSFPQTLGWNLEPLVCSTCGIPKQQLPKYLIELEARRLRAEVQTERAWWTESEDEEILSPFLYAQNE